MGEEENQPQMSLISFSTFLFIVFLCSFLNGYRFIFYLRQEVMEHTEQSRGLVRQLRVILLILNLYQQSQYYSGSFVVIPFMLLFKVSCTSTVICSYYFAVVTVPFSVCFIALSCFFSILSYQLILSSFLFFFFSNGLYLSWRSIRNHLSISQGRDEIKSAYTLLLPFSNPTCGIILSMLLLL